MSETCHSLCRCKCGDYYQDHMLTARAFEAETHDVDCTHRQRELRARIAEAGVIEEVEK